MAEYQWMPFGVLRTSDGANIHGPDANNPDWVAFESWRLKGNEPDPFESLESVRLVKIQELETQCDNALICGFESSSLGEPHIYDSDIVDQINLLGAVLVGGDIPYKYLKVGEAEKQWRVHTQEQMRNVVADGAMHRLVVLQKYTELKHMALTAQTIEAIKQVEWD